MTPSAPTLHLPSQEKTRGELPAVDELIDHLLTVARARLGMELAWISSFVGEEQVFDQISGPASAFGLSPGASSPLCDSYCARVLDGRLPNLIPDTTANPITAALEVTHGIGIGSYAGVPIRRPDGTASGMLCCINSGDATHLSANHVHTLELISALLAEILSTGEPRARERAKRDRIHEAITQQRFRIVYQPVIDIASGQLIGVEALSRFTNAPERPRTWFADAASVGLGVELELATIEAALRGLDQLEPTQYLAVNASPETVCDPRLRMAFSRSEPKQIVLELTEHTAITSYRTLCQALDELRADGVRIAVDDAGAGFSSLSHVLEIRPSILKIDRSIVNRLQVDPARQSLVEAIIDVADRVDATVIAEGIESRADLDCVGSLGITHAQGFFMGRPGVLPPSSHAPSAVVRDRHDSRSGTGNTSNEVDARRAELAMLHSPIGMALVSPSGAFLQVNPAFATILGCSTDDLADLNLRDLIAEDQTAGTTKVVHDFLNGSRHSFRAERQFRRPDGATRWGDVSVVLVRSEGNPTYFVVHLQDITERQVRERSLAQLAGTDHLTSIANRTAARRHLDVLAKAGHRIAIMYCDLRSFKQINDVYGHQTGDYVLQTVARRICGVVRIGDVVSRWGGDEFIVILPNASPRLLEEIRTRIVATVAEPVDLPHRVETIVPDITVGLASNDHGSSTGIDELVHRADTNMYEQRSVTLSI